MNKLEKTAQIDVLADKLSNSQYIYLADASSMTVSDVNELRRKCYEKEVEMKVVKNKLVMKAIEKLEDDKGLKSLYEALKGPTALMFSDQAAIPAKVVKEFRGKDKERPILKAAYIDSDVFMGDAEVLKLSSLKSKDELLGDVIMLLQSPMKNVLGALQSGQNTIGGLLKALESKGE